jgi:anti-sigma B factor antagonist
MAGLLDVTITRIDARTHLAHACGETDMDSAKELYAALEPLLVEDGSVTLDASRLDFIDSYGLSMLLKLALRARGRGAGFRLANPAPQVLRVMNMAGVAEILNGDETTDREQTAMAT